MDEKDIKRKEKVVERTWMDMMDDIKYRHERAARVDYEYHATWINKKGESKIRITKNVPRRRKYNDESGIDEYVPAEINDLDSYGWLLYDVTKVQVIEYGYCSYKSVVLHQGKTHLPSDYFNGVKILQKRRKKAK